MVDNVMFDSQGLPNIAMGQFIRKFSNGSFDLAYAIRSETAQPIAVTAGALNVPVMSHIASSDSLSNKVIYPTFFRSSSSDGLRATMVAKIFKNFNYRAVGLIYIDDAFGTAFRASLQSSLGALNIRLVAAGFRGTATGDDLYTEVKKALKVLIDERIRVIYHAGVDNLFLYALAKAASDADWITDRLYFANRAVTTSVLDQAPDKDLIVRFLRGSLIVSSASNQSNPNLIALKQEWLNLNVTQVNQYVPKFTAKNGVPLRVPDNYFMNLYPDLNSMRAYTVAYDAMMAIGFAACGTGQTLTASLASVRFQGVSGSVSFDSQYNRIGEGFSLDNIQPSGDSFKIVSVGSAPSAGNWTIDFGKIQFDDGTSNIPIDIEPPPHQIDQLTPGARIWGIIEATLAIGFSVGMLIYLLFHRTSKAFVESQPLFMFLLACGCVLMGASIIGLVVETNEGCMMFPWLFSLGFTLSLSSLIAKSVRVAILWYSRGPLKQRNHSVRATVLLGGIALSLGGLLCILIAWQIVSPLTFVINTTKRDSYDYPLYSSAMCATENSLSTTFLALIITYVCLVVFVTMWVSFWVRNAPEKFQEARMTAIAGVSMFQVFFVGIPTAAAVWNMALPRFLVLSSLTFLLCLIILATMFLPKIMRDRFGLEKSSEVNDPLADPNVDANMNHPMLNHKRGVLNVGAKRRKGKDKSDSGNYNKRSFVERVLESVQEVDDEAEEAEEEEPTSQSRIHDSSKDVKSSDHGQQKSNSVADKDSDEPISAAPLGRSSMDGISNSQNLVVI